MLIKEEKLEISDKNCSNCKSMMFVFQDTSPVELICGHEICL